MTPTPPDHRVLIGMEVHLQLRTASKMFCGCPVRFGAPPNTLVCPVCLGLPGSLPVPNRDAIVLALSLATAFGCDLAERTKFDRKHYFYPDLTKGYQISQYDLPLAKGGAIEIVTEGGEAKRIRLRRLHIEEDVGKSLHDDASGLSRLDFNRAGTPLVEIVSEPEIASPEEARAYLNALRAVVQYLDVSDGNMQEGNLRCEPNVNLHIDRGGRTIKTPIIEVKNLNSVRNVERAMQQEIERHLELWRTLGDRVADLPRGTRGFDDVRDTTFELREKEEAHDYRYFPEPDIPPITFGATWRAEAGARVPELPDARRRRFSTAYGLTAYDADLLCRERATADRFEAVVAAGAPPKPAANWLLAGGADIARLSPARLAEFVNLVEQGRVARQAAARDLLPRMAESDSPAAELIAELGLAQVEDASLLREAARRAIAAEPQAARDVRDGKQKALGALMGHVMRQTGGKASPQAVRSVLLDLLKEP